jgi:pimeloyl-ACP methyl ester carboxylesterase
MRFRAPWVGDAKCGLDSTDGDEGVREQQRDELTDPRSGSGGVCHVALAYANKLPGPVGAVVGLAPSGGEEERQSLLDLAAFTDGLQPPVILPSLDLQVSRQVEQRRRQAPFLVQARPISSRPMRPLPSRNGWMVSNPVAA